MDFLGHNHFLSLSRPDVLTGPPLGVPDTTTLAAHDFDVDTRTGFMPPQAPLSRLPTEWDSWENVLEDAVSSRLQLGDTPNIQDSESQTSERWRERVRQLPVLPIDHLTRSEVQLRRAHHVLAWIMHFYIHSLPASEPIRIPPPITIPLLQVSSQLQLPPLLTYSDDVLYNWHLNSDDHARLPSIPDLRCQTTFTSTNDEAEFYLTSARIELVGVEALDFMRSTMDELFVGDDIAVRRITEYLRQLVDVIHRLRDLLLEVKKGCNPQIFYHQIRPWFRGEDSQAGRRWIFDGMEQDPSLLPPTELSGPSAGQSSLIHALDIFLGVDRYSHGQNMTGHDALASETTHQQKLAFLQRMQLYMPRHHRAFLNHLSNNDRQLRDLVLSASSGTFPESFSSTEEARTKDGESLLLAYNATVTALKEFRDAHMTIVALYIVGPARHAHKSHDATSKETEPLKGTGGTELVRFLKGVRDQTQGSLIPH